jgi:DHA2 family multidrug resistance protein-like MFS transporter
VRAMRAHRVDLGARRWWVLGALVLAMLAIGLDVTVLSVALPTLAGALRASTAQLQWFVAAYTLVLAAALLPGGLLGDRYGRKKMLLISLAIFGAGSVACAYAGSAEAFIAARVIAGLGAAFAIPLSLSTLTVLFSEKERPRAVVVLGIIALVVLLPESRNPQRPRLDPAGVLTSSAGLAVLTYGIIQAGQHGWGDAVALVAMIAGLLVLVAFGLWEHRLGRQPGSRPLVDMRLFASAGFTWGTVLAAVGMFTMVGVLFTAPQHFQAVLGTDAMGSGVRLLPLIAGVVLGAGGADRIAARAGAKVTVASGFALLAAALLLGATTHMTSGYGFVAAWTALLGTGMGLALATAASAALGELSAAQAGVGSAVIQTVQRVGAPFGAAILGSVLNSGYRSRLDLAGLPASAAHAARDSVFAAIAVAHKLGLAPLLDSARTAFVHGMDVIAGAVATLAHPRTVMIFQRPLQVATRALGATRTAGRRGRSGEPQGNCTAAENARRCWLPPRLAPAVPLTCPRRAPAVPFRGHTKHGNTHDQQVCLHSANDSSS